MQPYNISCSIVLYHNEPAQIRVLINSVLAEADTLLFLIDNSKTDALRTLADNYRTTYIFNNANLGYGAAHNIAIKMAMPFAKYHLVVNPDVSFEKGTLESIYKFMTNNPAIGLLMPKVKYPNGELQYTCKLLPAPFDLFARRFLPARLIQSRMRLFEMRESGYDKLMQVPYLSGCFMFLQLEALAKVGLFDERYFMYPEDIDLTRRIHRHYKTVFFPDAEITHGYERGSYKSAKLLWVHIVNIIRYFNKWGWFFDRERIKINKKIVAQFKSSK